MGLRAFADRRFGTLSEGERKRVLLARALMTDPSCCCWTSRRPAWTSGRARRCCACSPGWRRTRTPRPTVLVTHHVEEVPVGTTHALLLSRGRRSRPARSRGADRAAAVAAFGLPLVVEERVGRYTARAAPF
jgi:iron complex transport system ATP-binding protein